MDDEKYSELRRQIGWGNTKRIRELDKIHSRLRVFFSKHYHGVVYKSTGDHQKVQTLYFDAYHIIGLIRDILDGKTTGQDIPVVAFHYSDGSSTLNRYDPDQDIEDEWDQWLDQEIEDEWDEL